jgi:hypothetical protein
VSGVANVGGVNGGLIGSSDSDGNNHEGLLASDDGVDISVSTTKGDLLLTGSGSNIPVRVTGNGDIEMIGGRVISGGGVALEVATSLKSASNYTGSYLLDDSGVYSIITHVNGARYSHSVGSPV